MGFADSDVNLPTSRAAGEMGASSSKTTKGLVVSLDALGTLYRFREPIAVQYSNVARKCGFKGEYETHQLESSFRSAFKEQNRLYPNYGKDELLDPQRWWEMLVEKTFKPFTSNEAPLPAETGRELYEHFTSGEAYELFPDVQPFLETITELKKEFADPEGPLVLTGIISNSDPRVRKILTSLGLRVGASKPVEVKMGLDLKKGWEEASKMRVVTPVNDMYHAEDNFNFMTTSYDAGAEKPDPHIFRHAADLAGQLTLSRIFQNNEHPQSMREGWSVVSKVMNAPMESSKRTWIHIGDDYDKDYQGARQYGFEALLLDREAKHADKENVISSLEDAGKVISILAYDSLRSES